MEEEGVGKPSIAAIPSETSRFFVRTAPTRATALYQHYWRSPAHSITILGAAIGTVLVLRLVSSDLSTTTYQGVSSGLGIIFIAFQSQGFVSFNSAIPFEFDDRAAFYREQASQTHSVLWYFLSGTLVEIPYVFVKGFIVSTILLLFIGFTSFSNFLLFWLGVSLSILSDVYLGHLLAFVFPNMIMAALSGSVVSTVFFLFVGFNPPGNSIPVGYQWLYTITTPCRSSGFLCMVTVLPLQYWMFPVVSTLTLGLNLDVSVWKLLRFPLVVSRLKSCWRTSTT
ncbi:ABC transporter G family member 40 [Phytophthora citrophthora]|uniref:ABC transporter G family member 40 n=1 Tax=Phytophthora citrophthora TaxID=4793 RepID=A0AAD9G1Q7_9STRA|nr:ABC transporter G family member 40 [Phytophthora citrophthora]